MTKYTIWYADNTPYEYKGRIYQFDTLSEARAWGRMECERYSNTYDKLYKGRYVLIRQDSNIVGLVYFDDNRRMYRGLGWVYIPLADKDFKRIKQIKFNEPISFPTKDYGEARKLYKNGDIAKFTRPEEIRMAKALLTYNAPYLFKIRKPSD